MAAARLQLVFYRSALAFRLNFAAVAQGVKSSACALFVGPTTCSGTAANFNTPAGAWPLSRSS